MSVCQYIVTWLSNHLQPYHVNFLHYVLFDSRLYIVYWHFLSYVVMLRRLKRTAWVMKWKTCRTKRPCSILSKHPSTFLKEVRNTMKILSHGSNSAFREPKCKIPEYQTDVIATLWLSVKFVHVPDFINNEHFYQKDQSESKGLEEWVKGCGMYHCIYFEVNSFIHCQ
jgi:hypothetical protein